MRFIRDETLKQAFIIMMNKLRLFHKIILYPYVQALKTDSDNESLKRIQEIHTLLAQNSEKREILMKLLSQGIIDPIIYNKETNKLLLQSDTYQKKIEFLNHTVSDSMTFVTEATKLLHFVEKASAVTAFDATLFDQFVDHILIRSRNEICFILKCGLTLTERR